MMMARYGCVLSIDQTYVHIAATFTRTCFSRCVCSVNVFACEHLVGGVYVCRAGHWITFVCEKSALVVQPNDRNK